MERIKCPDCNSLIEIKEDQTTCYCEYCQKDVPIPRSAEWYQAREHQRNREHEINMADRAAEEKEKDYKRTQKAKRSRLVLILVLVVILAAGAFAGWLYINHSHKGKVYMQMSSNSIIGQNYLTIQDELSNTGFTNIESDPINDLVQVMTVVETDRHGEPVAEAYQNNYSVGEIERISVDGQSSFSKGHWFSTDAAIVISYHDYGNQVSLGAGADYYIGKNSSDVEAVFSSAGFTNIVLEPSYDSTAMQSGRVGEIVSITIDGEDGYQAGDLVSDDATVKIVYHELKKQEAADTAAAEAAIAEEAGQIPVPDSAKNYTGKNYEDVVTALTTAGFTNITTEAVTDLINGVITHDGDVESISINGDSSFSMNDYFYPDAVIVVRYHTFKDDTPVQETEVPDSDNGMVAVPKSADSYIGKNYEKVTEELQEAGFTNITSNALNDIEGKTISVGNIISFDVPSFSDGDIESITIGGSTFEENETFSPDAAVVITYHSIQQ